MTMFFILLLCFSAAYGSGIPEIHNPQPYSFGYTIKDKEGVQHRQEAGNGAGTVQGNYGFIDNKGIRRQVDYVADHGGFRAQIKTNEPGTTGLSPAAVNMISNDPYAHGAVRPYQSLPNVPFVPALYESDGVYGFPTVKNFHPYIPVAQGYGYGPSYIGGLAYTNLLGAGYRQPGGIIYYGANLVGGKITGHDSRFTTQLGA